jgi:hypothetical protein
VFLVVERRIIAAESRSTAQRHRRPNPARIPKIGQSIFRMSRNTPAAIARQLRQQAGFGCCVCGSPILQYHHIIEWAEDQHFRLEDMMALCPLHHDQATKGAMPETEQLRLKANPHNIQRGLAKGLLAIRQDYCAANFGSVTVVGEGPFLRIDGEDILGFYVGDGNLEISLRLFSETDELLLEIDRNEWISGDPLPWDIEAGWQILTLRERARHISLSLNAKEVPLELRAELWRGGKRVGLDNNGISIGAIPAKGGMSELALVGMVLDVHTDKWSFGPNEGIDAGAMIVSWPNRRERLWKARDAWRKIAAAKAKVG